MPEQGRYGWIVALALWSFATVLAAGVVIYFIGLLAAAGALKSPITFGDVATAVGALVALSALFLGWYQLRGSTLQARATVLLSLDERWEVELDEARKTLYELMDRVIAGGPATPARYEAELVRLRTSPAAADRQEYRKLLRVIGFFETVAYATRATYIRISDVDNLLGGSIRETDLVFGREIAAQQRAYPRLYEHWAWLIAELRRRDGAR